jgi:hypothetical protein
MTLSGPIEDVSELATVRAALGSVFRETNCFGQPLKSNTEGALAFPDGLYSPTTEQFDRLALAASRLDETDAYIAVTEGTGSPSDIELVWRFDLRESPYGALNQHHTDVWAPALENAIFSTNGSWGIVFSQEDHAVLGGSKLFVSNFASRFPQERIGAEFVRTWRQRAVEWKTDIEWLPGLLENVYGATEANRLLAS